MSARTRGFTLVTYAAALDVPRHVVEFLARLLAVHRRGIGTPKGSRAAAGAGEQFGTGRGRELPCPFARCGGVLIILM
ncbi:hypothetical protein [Streptomyces flaveolus]|uniref:hypothetical protein n=1 Tax=Streptomyces flaveolus TaxID=67297 RepID=UPI00331F5F74